MSVSKIYTSVESYAHKAAKSVFAGWLRERSVKDNGQEWVNFFDLEWRANRAGPYYGIWEEYPITASGGGCNPVWDEERWMYDLENLEIHGDQQYADALAKAGSKTFSHFGQGSILYYTSQHIESMKNIAKNAHMNKKRRLTAEEKANLLRVFMDTKPTQSSFALNFYGADATVCDYNSGIGSPPPNYDQLTTLGIIPKIILDVAIQHKGSIKYGIEIVHKNDVSSTKREFLSKLPFDTYVIDAAWILGQVAQPTRFCHRCLIRGDHSIC